MHRKCSVLVKMNYELHKNVTSESCSLHGRYVMAEHLESISFLIILGILVSNSIDYPAALSSGTVFAVVSIVLSISL